MTWVDGRGRNFRRSIDDDFFAVCRPALGEVVDVGDSGEAAGPRQEVCELEDTRSLVQLLNASAQLGLFDEKALANIVNAVAKANRKGEHAFFEFVYNCGLGGGDGGTGGRASKFSEMAIVTLLNACSRLDVRHPLLLDALTRQLPCRPGRFNEAELALLANACSNLGALSPKAKQATTPQAKGNQNDGAAGGKDINLLDFLGREILNRTEIKNLRHAALISKATNLPSCTFFLCAQGAQRDCNDCGICGGWGSGILARDLYHLQEHG
eukprot:g1384.t1